MKNLLSIIILFWDKILSNTQKNLIFCTFTLFVFTGAYAQFGPKQIISQDELSTPRKIYLSDIDNNGFIDILTASSNEISVFYNNLQNNGFSSQVVVVDGISLNYALCASDLDGDGDQDIMGASFEQNSRIFWVENLLETASFSGKNYFLSSFSGPYDIITTDLDGDGDQDVVVQIDGVDKIIYYKNLDGLGNFGPPQIVTTGGTNGRSVKAADLDGDGDMDLAASGSGGIQLSWFENTDSEGTYGPVQVIQGEGSGVQSIFLADFDNDGDMDILKGVYVGPLAWHENIDGFGTFGAEQVIDSSIQFIVSVFAADLDNDGDMDALATNDNSASWWENTDGQGTFGPKQDFATDFNFAIGILAADLDNDGDQDVIVAGQNDDTISWFENLTILSVPKEQLIDFSIFPNPAHDTIRLNVKGVNDYQITVTDMLGRIILKNEQNLNIVDLSSLASGVFLIVVSDGQKKLTKKIVKI